MDNTSRPDQRPPSILGVASGHPLNSHLESGDQRLLADLRQRLGQTSGICQEGVDSIRSRLEKDLPDDTDVRAIFLYSLACLLVDLGTESKDNKAVEEATDLFRRIEARIVALVSPTIFRYNYANALKSIADFSRPKEYNLEAVVPSLAAKKVYWQAIRDLDKQHALLPELMINLANMLDQSCRIREALYWYDLALATDPQHAMAHGNRAQALGTLHWLTDQFSISMLSQAVQGFAKGLEKSDLQQTARNLWQTNHDNLIEILSELGEPDLDSLEEEVQIEEKDAEHSDYQTFCIGNGLTLSEHGIYCRCIGARRDDLSIMKSASPIRGDFVPRLELLLNRLKAELSFARSLYYQGTTSGDRSWEMTEYEGTYSDLQDHEVISLQSEMLRTSLRLCFGILDRIAFGVCDALEIETFGRPLYFTSFWKDRGLRADARSERWRRLNELSTPSLAALYSQATDLEIRDGEWGHFKEWRNALEHHLLFLIHDDKDLGPFVDDGDFKGALRIPLSEFRREALHMLRFTVSAIVNFALFVRQLALRQPDGGPAITVALDKKPIGPE